MHVAYKKASLESHDLGEAKNYRIKTKLKPNLINESIKTIINLNLNNQLSDDRHHLFSVSES